MKFCPASHSGKWNDPINSVMRSYVVATNWAIRMKHVLSLRTHYSESDTSLRSIIIYDIKIAASIVHSKRDYCNFLYPTTIFLSLK